MQIWQEFRSPLLGAVAAAALALGGRFLGIGWLRAAAGGAGVALGWVLLTGAIVGSPRLLVERLPAVALAAVALPLGAQALSPRHGRVLAALLVAAFAGWWLAGGPRSRADLLQAWPAAVAIAAFLLLLARLAAGQTATALAGAAAALGIGLQTAGVTPIWPLLAYAVLAPAAALVIDAEAAAAALLALAADLGAAAAAAVLGSGRLTRGGFGAVELAALAPVLVLWLAPRIAARLGFAGRLAGLLAAAAAAGVAIGLLRLGRLLLHGG